VRRRGQNHQNLPLPGLASRRPAVLAINPAIPRPKPRSPPFSFARPRRRYPGLLLRSRSLVAFAAAGEEAAQVNTRDLFFFLYRSCCFCARG
jgi:hypothetical protein